MDESFGDLAKLLQFRDKEQERVEKYEKKKKGELSPDDVEMDAWDKEMKVCVAANNLSYLLLSMFTFTCMV